MTELIHDDLPNYMDLTEQRPLQPEPVKLTPRQRKIMAGVFGAAAVFAAGMAVGEQHATQPEPVASNTTSTTTTTAENSTVEVDPSVLASLFTEEEVKSRLLEQRPLAYFHGSVKVTSYDGKVTQTINDPIVLSHKDVFSPATGYHAAQQPGGFDDKLYAIAYVVPGNFSSRGMPVSTDFLDDSTTMTFFDTAGQVVEQPEYLSPETPSAFMNHVTYSTDLHATTREGSYAIVTPDGTQISYPAAS